MSKIYYGNGESELEAIDAVFCEIKVKYPIEITDKTPYEFALLTRSGSNKIIIGRIRKGDSTLKELFNYKGDLIITKAVIINKNRDRIRCTLQKVMDYSELLESNSEDLTIKSEDLKVTSIKGKAVTKMKMMKNIVGDFKSTAGQFFLKDGSEYSGAYHVHLETGRRMSGAGHTEYSQDLYFKEENDGIVSNKLTITSFHNYMNTKYMKVRSRVKNKNVRISKRIGRNT